MSKKELDQLQKVLGDVNYSDMMEDFTDSISDTFNAKIDEYVERLPSTYEALITLMNMSPGSLVTLLLRLHRTQRELIGSNDTPIRRMYADAVELFNMTDDEMESAREQLNATQH